MSTRDKSDFGSGKILPGERPDGESPDAPGSGSDVHPERPGARGPDIPAAERGAVQRGAHLRADEPDDLPDEPLDPPHPPRHVRDDG